MNKSIFAAIMIAIQLFTFQSPSFAANYDIKQMTPAVEKALSGRQARYEQLQSLKSSGALGEDNRGFVKALGSMPGAEEIAASENADRRVIYTAIAEQNNLGPGGMAQIEAVFADVQREKARPGDSIQLPSGAWTKK